MINILVVDDERMIRIGIKAMLERKFTNFNIYVACDGLDALEVLESNQINIVITDIMMPRMDGIQLIEQMQQMEPTPLVVILSGYDDFSFAKQAIKYQVMDYLLKPVDRNELFQIMNSAKEKLETNLAMTKNMDEYQNNQLNYMLLNPTIEEEEVEKIVHKLQLTDYVNGYYVGIFHFKGTKGSFVKEEFFQHIEKQLHNFDEHAFSFIDTKGNLVVFTEIVDMFHHVLEECNLQPVCPLCVAISEKNMLKRKIKEAYGQANEALAYKFIFPNQQVFTYQEIENKKEGFTIEEQPFQKIYNMLGTDRHNEIKSTLLDVFNVEGLKNYNLTYVHALSNAINTIIFDQAFNELEKESSEIFKLNEQVVDIANFDSIHDYFHAVENLTMHLHEYMKEMKMIHSEDRIMEKAIAFIHENAHKDLNMAVVSNHISLNYSYFSHAFKEYTGENFVDYLKKVRIEKAKELLSDLNNKIFEVSELVGFKNPKQFSRVFRKLVGISPKEYREKL